MNEIVWITLIALLGSKRLSRGIKIELNALKAESAKLQSKEIIIFMEFLSLCKNSYKFS